ncbi:hypothetical protein [Pleionea sp. CnH1-48]|uniref:hypothetical protein n=1 Tax=Pleionea sp. CnH1-48 TaxID=2954494 RepID=UPI002097EE1F|nr:hypothetical protein [Pleionea sp. CnH1-48]MCO7226798.1 hypothetical protein [Pleionea sp. CnH1-48]
MEQQLTQKDRDYIWQIVHHAAQSVGGYDHLFSSPLNFSEDNNRIHFDWPVWMRAIKAYITSQYGEDSVDSRLIEILAEVYDPGKYRNYLENAPLTTPLPGNQHPTQLNIKVG